MSVRDITKSHRSMNIAARVALALTACLAKTATADQYILETQPALRIEATLTQEIRAPGLDADEWVAFIAKPLELPSQSNITVSTEPKGQPVNDVSELKRPLMMIRAPGRAGGAKNKFTIHAKYQATLHSRRLRQIPSIQGGSGGDGDNGHAPFVAPLSDDQRNQWLARTNHFDFESGEFQEWIKDNDLMRAGEENDIDFARRVFSTIKTGFTYDYRAEMDRRASAIIAQKKSDCGGLSVLFASALRANNIPARVLVGRWASSSKPGEKLNGIRYHQCHVKAEFFAENVGWVPVDMSAAILHDVQGDGLRYFGRDRGDFITMHLDPEVIMDTIHFGEKQTPWLQGVTFWVTGQGNLDKLTTEENWSVKKLENDEDWSSTRTSS